MKQEWIDYFMDIAKQVSTRATCDRLHVGAVIIKDRRIVSTGYNGSLPGTPHCDDVGHDLEDGHCVRTIHAERNAIYYAARYGIPTAGSTIVITHFPCLGCFKAIVSAGIVKIIYDDIYREDVHKNVFRYIEDIGGHHYRENKWVHIPKRELEL